jgi:copper oxidase (laccase) domain-containing protein
MAGESDARFHVQKDWDSRFLRGLYADFYLCIKRMKSSQAFIPAGRETQKKNLEKTLRKLSVNFNSQPEDLFCFIGPSISQKNYEVGKEVWELFDNKY